MITLCLAVNGIAQSGKIKTYTSEDWDYWEVDYAGNSGKVKTYTSEDWDYWEYSGDASGKIKTYSSEDWDYWEISGNLSSLTPQKQMAVMFVAIFTSSIHIRGINK